ncbi:MAG: diguanylate cyclase [Candidatus Bipolaricaulota bacterium]
MFGYAADEAYGELIDALIMPDKHAKRFRRAFHKFCETGEDVEMSHTVEMTAKRRDGTTFPVEISHSSFELEDELHAVAIIRDISEKKQTEQQLQKEREKSRQLHGSVDKLQQRETEEEVLETAIEVAEKVLDFDQCAIGILEGDYVVPKAVSSDLSLDKSARFNVGEGITGKAIELGETIWGDDIREHPDARPTNEDFRSFISAPIGDVGNLQVVATEVGSFDQGDVDLLEILTGHIQEEIHRVRLENELKEQAIRDPLTNLYNRRYLANVMNKEAERAKRYEKPIAFIMIDINGFKTVNDEFSHRTGDRVLGEIANLLKENVRNADTVVRYGGDEFLIMMPETDGEAHTTVKRLKKEMEKWNENCDLIEGFFLSLAMGVSHWDRERSIDIERALMEADKRMYEDKRDGGPRRERVYPTTGK